MDGEWQTEIIRDGPVINAYVRARQQIEEETTLADNLAPTGDADTDKRYKKRCVSCDVTVQLHMLNGWHACRGYTW